MAASLRPTARQATNGHSSCTTPLAATANGSVLSQDLLYEILVRLPAKSLCRLRAVCLSWRSLLSESSFVAAHSARHGPFVAAFKREPVGVHILDTSGHTLRYICSDKSNYPQPHYRNVACISLDLFCFIGGADNFPHVINPATGIISRLPDDSEFHQNSHFVTRFVLGRASSKGEAKVLAVKMGSRNGCKVLTLGGADEWRDTGRPPAKLVNSSICVALVKGVLYFMGYTTCRHDRIAAYNLETETWRPDPIHFPPPAVKEEANCLVELSDSLVAVYNSRPDNNDVFMDLWFLADSEKVIWSKHYTITMSFHGFPSDAFPLCRLDDGKIVFWVWRCWKKNAEVQSVDVLRVYDPSTKTYTDGPEMPGCAFVGVYKGSLLAGLP